MLNLFNFRTRINYNNTLKKIEFKNFFKIQFNKYNFADVAKKQEAPAKETKVEENNVDILKFKPFEEFTKEEVQEKISLHKKEVYNYFGSMNRLTQTKDFNKTEFAAKKLRQMWIRAGDLSTHKHVIPIKRLRTREEGLFKLMNQGELAGVIEGREEFPDINFVVDKSYVKRLESIPLANVKPFYLKFGNDEIKCTFIRKDRLPAHNYPTKIRFQRFIEGRPNLLTLKIKIVGRHVQPYLQNLGVEIAQYYHEVDVWTTTEDYLPLIELDARFISPDKPFKFLDLSLLLPEGMWLHRKYDRVMYNSIASMGENFNMILASTLYPADDPDNVSGAGNNDEAELSGDLKQMNDFIEQTQGPKQNKKKALSMPLAVASSKKLLQIKSEGADTKAIRKLMKTSGEKKIKKGAPAAGGKKPAGDKPAAK